MEGLSCSLKVEGVAREILFFRSIRETRSTEICDSVTGNAALITGKMSACLGKSFSCLPLFRIGRYQAWGIGAHFLAAFLATHFLSSTG